MAQYGKSYYGASYYGASGVFTGQFQSDQTTLLAPVDDLVFEVIAKINRKLYKLPASIPLSGMIRSDDTTDQYLEYWRSIYRVGGEWTGEETADTGAIITASFSGSNIKILFGTPVTAAIANIVIRRYELGEVVEALGPYTVDTALQSEFLMDLAFGEYEVDTIIDPISAVGSSLIFSGLEITTNDISLELRTENSSIWSDWARIPLTRQEIEPGVFTLSSGTITGLVDGSASINALGATGYEFRIFMATSEDENSPEITKLEARTSNIHTRAEVGIWKMAIDMGFGALVGVDDVLSVEYDADIPEGTKLSIQTRSTDDTDIENPMVAEGDISWSDWSVPYSKADYRMIIDTKTNPALRSAVIYTPVITPENLQRWTRMLPKMYINHYDPLNADLSNQVINNHSSIKIDVLDGNLDIIKTSDQWGSTNESRYLFTKPLKEAVSYYTGDGQSIFIGEMKKADILLVKTNEYNHDINLMEGSGDSTDGDYYFSDNDTIINLRDPIGVNEKVTLREIVPFENIDVPIRLRIFILRDLPYSTPAIEDINMFAQSEYSEIKTFNELSFVSYASAVFGDNTGEDYLYLDGKTRNMEASVFNLGFALPGIESPEGIIPMDYAIYTVESKPSNVDIFWDDTTNESTTTVSGRLVARVNADGKVIRKHAQYGSGITLSIDGEDFPDSQSTTAIFAPPLDLSKEYAYHIRNGYTDEETINTNVEVRWKTENDLPEQSRRNISYIQSDEVYSSIKSAITGNIIDWKSEEIMLEGYVNLGSPSQPMPYLETISARLPEIPTDAIITAENPYIVEIVPNTVKSEGEIKDESRVKLEMDESYRKYIDVTEEKVLLVRGPADTNQDFLPKANTTLVYGVYRNRQDYAPTFWEGTHFTITDGRIIDWSIMINNPGYSGPTPPVEDEELYISYTYEKLSEIKIIGECEYNRNDYSSVSIYRSKDAIGMNGICSYGSDYISDQLSLESMFAIPEDVDKRTLRPKVVITDNPYVEWYEKDNRIIVTLGDINPKENWHPTIKEGFYYLGRDSYYLFSSPNELKLDSSMTPKATNVSYVKFNDGLAAAIQEGTVNMIRNPAFLESSINSVIFKDGFER